MGGSDTDAYGLDDGLNDGLDDGLDDDLGHGAEDDRGPHVRRRLASGRPGRRPRAYRVLRAVLVVGLVVVLVLVGSIWFLTHRYAGTVARLPGVFSALDPALRPPPPPLGPTGQAPLTFLVVGTDSGQAPPTVQPGGPVGDAEAGSDVLMLVQIAGDRQSVQVVAIPTLSFVPIPGYPDGQIANAFALGGPTLTVQTVEALTHVRIDHFAQLEVSGFREVTDALGGVDVPIAEAGQFAGVTFTRGLNHLDGRGALAYLRQPRPVPADSFFRMQRVQNFLRAVVTTVSRENLLVQPGRLDDFLLALSSSLSVDDELSDGDLATLIVSLRHLDQSDIDFVTAPVTGTGTEGGRPAVYLDENAADQMWSYLNDGSLQRHLGEFPRLPRVPR